MLLILGLLIAIAINFFLFLIAYNLQSDKLTDFAYAISFITVTLVALMFTSERSGLLLILSAMVFIWALRLGGFLVYRISKAGKDTRFDEIRQDYFKFLKFWLAQGAIAWVLLLPVLFVAGHGEGPTSLSFAGVIIWLVGLLTEAIADQQKYKFTSNTAHKGRWIDRGLWRYSRHPNYFGEITIWVGMYVTTFSALSGYEKVVGLISPTVIFITLMFISGVPLLEKSADARWGDDKAYRAYRDRTSLLIPLWPKR